MDLYLRLYDVMLGTVLFRVTVRRELLLHAEVSKFDFKQMNGRPCGHIYFYY